MSYYVYILRLENDHFYIGSTNDLSRQVSEHRANHGCRTTSVSLVEELLYSEVFPDLAPALNRERQLKG